ncbi:aldehyde dehydrogenase (NADP(+)) [Ohtaekwangia sp.]|uniref:aldehyde dehydrogenase (NADP(+)) n=1 Tax=Ohtaekwangia sp. TaxID=2066019 RepID=UPI002FDCD951
MSGLSEDDVLQRADKAFQVYRYISAQKRAAFLHAIAAEIDNLTDDLIRIAAEETCLPEARLKNERGRTTNQLKAFAQLLQAGDWVQATIDTGDTERKPLPRPDLRKMLFPIGPVVVFGASNFPLAFSTAGGDTASALASGCTVVVKSHPAHPRTSALVSSAIREAIRQCGLPGDIFQEVSDTSIEAGQRLVQHRLTKAVAFTGSFQGGKALFDLAGKREEPIPVYAEMGSINPVVLLPGIVRESDTLPATLASSILLGVGQFCTNPGLLIALDTDGFTSFLHKLAAEMAQASPGNMLHTGIAAAYKHKKSEALHQKGVHTLIQEKTDTTERQGAPALALVDARDFIANPILKEEVFGPYSLIVKCEDEEELKRVVQSLKGQLTATVFGLPQELPVYREVIGLLQTRCGRLICNGVPTGVEVTKAMQHGGPYPSSTDSKFTSVGTDAIYRFVRPVCFQDFPEALLPPELQNKNELNIWRCVNNTWTRAAIQTFNLQQA